MEYDGTEYNPRHHEPAIPPGTVRPVVVPTVEDVHRRTAEQIRNLDNKDICDERSESVEWSG